MVSAGLGPRHGVKSGERRGTRLSLGRIRPLPPSAGLGPAARRGRAQRHAAQRTLRSASCLRSGAEALLQAPPKNQHLKAHPFGKLPRGPGKADREGLWERGELSLELPKVSRFVKGAGILIAPESPRPFPFPEHN